MLGFLGHQESQVQSLSFYIGSQVDLARGSGFRVGVWGVVFRVQSLGLRVGGLGLGI